VFYIIIVSMTYFRGEKNKIIGLLSTKNLSRSKKPV
jgi:hypothetical protein